MLRLKSFTFNPFQENTYLLINEAMEALVIDPGMYSEEEIETFEEFILAEGLNPVGIINTHAHIDHIFGVTYLKTKYEIPFELSAAELPILQNAISSSLIFGLKIDAVPVPDKFFEENGQISFGGSLIKILFTPGHSPGSVSFYIPDQKMILSGDVLFKNSIGRTDLPMGNFEQLVDSIETMLFILPEDTVVYPGHGPSTTIGSEMRDGYLASLRRN